MADGTSKPIDQIKPGDKIANNLPGTNPGTKDQTHTVTAVHVTYTDHDYTDVTIDTGHGPATITGTAHHPYWDQTTHTWTDANQLHPDDRLQTASGNTVTVVALRNYTATMVTYNLTIDTLHTYYVEAGDTPVLVHNAPAYCGIGNISSGSTLEHTIDSSKGPIQIMANVNVEDGDVVLSDVAVYGDGIPRNGLGMEGTAIILRDIRTNVLPALADQGYGGKKLIIQGVRLSGPVGHSPDLTFNIPTG
jgi:hypothetical protein